MQDVRPPDQEDLPDELRGFVLRLDPPPHVGWWACVDEVSVSEVEYRWWDGVLWSFPLEEGNDDEVAAIVAENKDTTLYWGPVWWCHYWPAHGEVARLNPENGILTGYIENTTMYDVFAGNWKN